MLHKFKTDVKSKLGIKYFRYRKGDVTQTYLITMNFMAAAIDI